MIEITKLRNKPELKVIFYTNEFEIVDVSKPKNNGIYQFKEIKSIELNKAQTNWFVSILSLIVDLFTGIGNGGKFKSKANLKIDLLSEDLNISLTNVDIKMAKKVATHLSTYLNR